MGKSVPDKRFAKLAGCQYMSGWEYVTERAVCCGVVPVGIAFGGIEPCRGAKISHADS